MSDQNEFFVGYGDLPDKERRFLLKAIPLGLMGLAGVGAAFGVSAPSAGGGRWETGKLVTLTGRIGFHPYPTLWVNGKGIVIAGFGKKGADSYIRPFDKQVVEVRGVKIVREKCFMLGVAKGDIQAVSTELAPLPEIEILGDVSLIGEILDAQCFMGVMNPGYGQSHRGCATQCIRGGQPVYFSMGFNRNRDSGGVTSCGGLGYLLANAHGEKVNAEILGHVAVPVTLSARHERIGNLNRLTYQTSSLKRLS